MIEGKPSSTTPKRRETIPCHRLNNSQLRQLLKDGASGNSLIGTSFHRDFGKYGWFEGTITGYWPDDDLYHIEYMDDDNEDLSYNDLQEYVDGSK